MTVTSPSDVYYDPYDVDIDRDPYPVYRRLREEAPLYFNEQHGFYAVSRYEDVERTEHDNQTFISGRGGIIEMIKAGVQMPPGILIFEDPPTHTIHRRLLSRMFTPKRVAALEPQIRELCRECLDPVSDGDEFDFVADFGAHLPMRVIGMLLGIPDEDQAAIRDSVNKNLATEAGAPMDVQEDFIRGHRFAAWVDERIDHPQDDIMSELLHAEFEDETGTRRTLTRDEVLTYVSVVAGAGNETTTKLIGWMGKVLAEHPDQRRDIVEDPSLVPAAVEELLRFESPAPHAARYVARDVEVHGETIEEGSIMLMLMASANRDDRRFADGDTFDIHRELVPHISFGHGIHFCLGASLARLEARCALEELLQRFPSWEVDLSAAELAPTSTVRGWKAMPAVMHAA